METGNRLVVFLVLSLCSHLVHNADATCTTRSFRYLLPASGSPPPASTTNKSSAAPAPLPIPVSEPASAPSVSKTPAQPQEPKSNIPWVIRELPVPNSQLTKVCEFTENPMLCLSTVAPFLQGGFDPVSILNGEILAIQNHTKVVMENACKIAEDPSTPQDVVEALDYCKENYESVAVNLADAMKGIAKRDVGLLNSMLTAVAADVMTCQDTFGEITTSASPMAAMDEMTKNMAYNCLAIIDYLKW